METATTKRAYVMRMANKMGWKQEDCRNAVENFLTLLREDLSARRRIELRGFGVFSVKIQKGKKGRNPRKPKDEVMIPAHYKVKFTAGKEIKRKLWSTPHEK